MGVELTGVQFFILSSLIIVLPILGFFLFGRKSSVTKEQQDVSSRRSLAGTVIEKEDNFIEVSDIDWCSLYSGWLKGKALSFEDQKVPLVATIRDIEQKHAWSQPAKIGVNPILHVTKNYLEQFGSMVLTVASINREEVARNLIWGLASYLNSVAGRVLVFEICQKSSRKKQTARIDISIRRFDDLPDPKPSDTQNVDVVTFDQYYTWPEDILTLETIEAFTDHYKKIYPLILIVTPPILQNGFARKAASCSDCFMLIGSKFDDQSILVDSYQRIKYFGRTEAKNNLVVWGVQEKIN